MKKLFLGLCGAMIMASVGVWAEEGNATQNIYLKTQSGFSAISVSDIGTSGEPIMFPEPHGGSITDQTAELTFTNDSDTGTMDITAEYALPYFANPVTTEITSESVGGIGHTISLEIGTAKVLISDITNDGAEYINTLTYDISASGLSRDTAYTGAAYFTFVPQT